MFWTVSDRQLTNTLDKGENFEQLFSETDTTYANRQTVDETQGYTGAALNGGGRPMDGGERWGRTAGSQLWAVVCVLLAVGGGRCAVGGGRWAVGDRVAGR